MGKINSGRKLGVYVPYRILHKYKVIAKEKRLSFLISESERSNPIPAVSGLRVMRSSFNRMRGWRFVIKGQSCYCCESQAQVRHHVTPLSKGGRNKDNNIVPLCRRCHEKVHPWLGSKN